MFHKLLRDPKFFLFVSVIVALLHPDWGIILKDYIFLILFFTILIPLLRVKTPSFNYQNFKFAWKMFFLSYIVFLFVTILISRFIENEMFRVSFILLGSMPPAIMIIRNTFLMKGHMEKALYSEIFLYIISLLMTPLIIWIFYRESINIFLVIKNLAILLIIPFIISRPFYMKFKWDFKEILNILAGLGVYIAVALNVKIILSDFLSFIPLFIAFFILEFGLIFLIYAYTKIKKIPKQDSVIYILFGTSKNAQLALGFSLLLFPPLVALPFVVSAIVSIFHFIFLLWLYK